jgi:hypothetical protein
VTAGTGGAGGRRTLPRIGRWRGGVKARRGSPKAGLGYYDWSELDPSWQSSSGSFPVVPDSALKATLGILDRTIRRRAVEP